MPISILFLKGVNFAKRVSALSIEFEKEKALKITFFLSSTSEAKYKKLNKDLFRTELIKKEQTTSVVGSDVDLERIADFKMDKSTVDYIKDLANKDDIGLVPAPVQKQKPKLLNEEITLKYEKGSKKDIVIKTDAEILSFVEVRIDGKVLDKSKYEVREGSTIIALKNSYLETLPIGTYELEIVSKATDKYEASSVKIKFVVLEDASKVRSDRKLVNKQNPNTGDFGIMISAMTLIVAGAALAVTKKKKD